MKETTKRWILQILLFSTILAACLAAFYAMRNFGQGSYHHGSIIALAEGWQCQSGGETQSLPALPTAVPWSPEGITLTRRLPEELPVNPTLGFISRQSSVEVILDGKTIYSYGLTSPAPVGNLLGNVRNVIHLPYDAGGQELSIRLICPYAQGSYRISDISLGTREAMMHRFMHANLGLVIFSLFSVFFCLMALLTAAFFKMKKVNFHGSSLVYFSLFILFSASWVITDCNILQILSPNFPVVYFVSHLCFMLIPLPLMMFLRQATRYKPRAYGVLLTLSCACLFGRLLLFFAGIADLESTLFLTHLLMVVSAVTCVALLAREWALYRERSALLFLIGFISLFCCLGLSLVTFLFLNNLDYSLYFRIMLSLMMGAMFYEIFSKFAIMAKKDIERKLYQQLAYNDRLTGMLNRRAFDEHMAALQAAPDCRMLTIGVFDIDRLKHANDTYGHSVGDELIKCAAEHIRSSFEPLGSCFRIGGDEFTVVIRDIQPPLLEKTIEDFRTNLAEAVLSTAEPLAVAAGFSTGPTQGDRFADVLFDQADQDMYQNKAKCKQ